MYIYKSHFTGPHFFSIFWVLLQNYELTYQYFGSIPVGAFALLKFKQTRHIWIYWAWSSSPPWPHHPKREGGRSQLKEMRFMKNIGRKNSILPEKKQDFFVSYEAIYNCKLNNTSQLGRSWRSIRTVHLSGCGTSIFTVLILTIQQPNFWWECPRCTCWNACSWISTYRSGHRSYTKQMESPKSGVRVLSTQ